MAEDRSRGGLAAEFGGRLGPEKGMIRGALQRLALLSNSVRRGTGDEEQPRAMIEFFADQLQEVAGRGEPIVIEVSEEALWYDGEEVLGGDLLSEALVEGLHEQGLLAVFIEPGVHLVELQNLANLLARNWRDKTYTDEDLEAASWAAGFDHVHLDVATRTVLNMGDDERPDPDMMVYRLVRQLGAQGLAERGIELEHEVGELMKVLRALPRELPEDPAFERLSERGAHRRVRKQVELLRRKADVEDARLGEVLFDAVLAAPRLEVAVELVETLLEHVLRGLASGEPDAAMCWVRRLILMRDQELLGSGRRQRAVSKVLDRLVGEEGRGALLAGIEANPDPVSWKGVLFTWCHLAATGELDPVFELGASLPTTELRQCVADAALLLLRRTDQKPRDLLKAADDTRLPMVLQMLRRLGDPTLVEPMLSRISSESWKVREAVLLALRDQQSPRIKQIVREAIGGDPSQAVRLEALRYSAVYRDHDAAEIALERLKSASADAVGLDELKALARVSALVLRDEALPVLEQIVVDQKRYPHPEAATAALQGMTGAGFAGRKMLENIGRTHPERRDEIRGILGGTA